MAKISFQEPKILAKKGYWNFEYENRFYSMNEVIECKLINAIIVNKDTIQANQTLAQWKPILANNNFIDYFIKQHNPQHNIYWIHAKSQKQKRKWVLIITALLTISSAFMLLKTCHSSTTHNESQMKQDLQATAEQGESLQCGDTIFINNKWAIYNGCNDNQVHIETNEVLNRNECEDLYSRYDLFKEKVLFVSLRNNSSSSAYLIFNGSMFYKSDEENRDTLIDSKDNKDESISSKESSVSSIAHTTNHDTPITSLSSLNLMETIGQIAKKTKIVGVWANPPYNYVIYVKKGRYYLGAIEKGNTEILGDDPLRKKSSRLYVSTDAGDMPERYVIDSYGDLSVYVYNPEVNEWVDYGKYNQIY